MGPGEDERGEAGSETVKHGRSGVAPEGDPDERGDGAGQDYDRPEPAGSGRFLDEGRSVQGAGMPPETEPPDAARSPPLPAHLDLDAAPREHEGGAGVAQLMPGDDEGMERAQGEPGERGAPDRPESQREDVYASPSFPAIFDQVSFNVTVRLKTRCPGRLSGSRQK